MFTHYPKDPKWEVCEQTKSTRARCRIKPKKRVDGIDFSTKFEDLITADHKNLNVEDESRSGHKNDPVAQDCFTNWTHSYQMKTKETSETMS